MKCEREEWGEGGVAERVRDDITEYVLAQKSDKFLHAKSITSLFVHFQISSLKAELGRPSEIPRQPPPLPIESASKPPEKAPPTKKEKEPSTGDDDAFEEGVASPVAPCPYLSFVPLQDDPRARHKKGKDSKA